MAIRFNPDFMIACLDRIWRFLATTICFVVFGVGGVLIRLFIVPLLYLLPTTPFSRQRWIRNVFHHTLKGYVLLLRCLGVLSYDVSGMSKLTGAKLVIANHPTLIDILFLLALIPNANCIVKGALLRNFFLRGPVKAAGYIINQDAAMDVMNAAQQAIDSGDTLIVFPEGTRSTLDENLLLKRGAANIAVRTNTDLTPVVITCEPLTLTKDTAWYQIPCKRPHITLRIDDTISIKPYMKYKTASVSARMLTADLTEYFTKEIALDDRSTP